MTEQVDTARSGNGAGEVNRGKIAQVMGPVVDVEFLPDRLPALREKLVVEIPAGGARGAVGPDAAGPGANKEPGKAADTLNPLVMEVAQYVGNNTVRCVMLLSLIHI